MTQVLVTGAGGQLAWELAQTVPSFVNLISLSSSELDITDYVAVQEVVGKYQPDIIINAAAYTAVDKAENEQTLAYAVNATGAENLAKIAAELQLRLLHVSTDFVFDGTCTAPYQPDNQPNPINVYGASKLAGEQLVRAAKPDAVVVRTAWVYSTHGTNFVKTMLRLMSEKDQLGVIYDQIGTPTYARNLAKWLWAVAEKPDVAGIFHWTDAGVASWYDFACAIQSFGLNMGLLEREIPVMPISTSAYPTPAKRPAFSVIDKTSAEQAAELNTEHWQKALNEMMSQLKPD